MAPAKPGEDSKAADKKRKEGPNGERVRDSKRKMAAEPESDVEEEEEEEGPEAPAEAQIARRTTPPKKQ